jgi:hypothetical protein
MALEREGADLVGSTGRPRNEKAGAGVSGEEEEVEGDDLNGEPDTTNLLLSAISDNVIAGAKDAYTDKQVQGTLLKVSLVGHSLVCLLLSRADIGTALQFRKVAKKLCWNECVRQSLKEITLRLKAEFTTDAAQDLFSAVDSE